MPLYRAGLQSLLSSNGQTIFHDGTSIVAAAATARFKVGSFSVPGATGNLAVTGLGFKPGLVQFNFGWTDLTENLGGQGAMDAAGNQWAACWSSNNVPQRYSARSTAAAIYFRVPGPTTVYSAAFVSMDTDGFTINFSAVNASGRVSWIAYR